MAVLNRFYYTEKCISTDQEELVAESHPFKEIDWELGALCYFLFQNHLAGEERPIVLCIVFLLVYSFVVVFSVSSSVWP